MLRQRESMLLRRIPPALFCSHPKDLGDLLTPVELRARRRAAVRAYFGTEATE